jgi:hypothetical protein
MTPAHPFHRAHRSRSTSAFTIRALAVLACAAIIPLAGCNGASGRADAALVDTPVTTDNPAATAHAVVDRGPALTARQGLQIRRILMPHDDATLRNAITSVRSHDLHHALDNALDKESAERWRRNGLRLVRMSPAQADALVQTLGSVMVDRDEWHGEILDWTALQNTVTGELRAVAVEQRIERFQPGEFQLMLRGWTMPNEHGARLYLEFVARYHQPQSVNFLDLVQNDDDDLTGVILDPVSLPIVLEPDVVYLLTSASPLDLWPTNAQPGSTGEPHTPDTPAPKRTAGRGPGTGPVAIAPSTIGELLMIEPGAPARRTILLLQAQTGSARMTGMTGMSGMSGMSRTTR